MSLTDDMGRLREEINESQETRIFLGVAELLKNDHKEGINRIKECKERAGEVAKLLADFQTDRKEMAKKTRKELAAFSFQIAEYVTNLRAEYAAILREECGEARENRLEYLSGLKQTVNEILHDVAGARAVWHGKKASVQSPKTKPIAKPEPKAKSFQQDDLKRIKGIGDATQKHLNKMGIYTFDELAHSSSEELRANLGDSGKFADVGAWMIEAKKMAK